ncbi:MAG: hypothetical protein ACLQBX_15825 [Candidatus Limnocylindrales bacterium]
MTVYSTFPEASYALALTKPGQWPRQHEVVEIICAHAAAHRIIQGEIHLSERGLAARLHSSASSRARTHELLGKLAERRVLRLLHAGEGTAPSIWRIWHWTRWEVPWRIRPVSVEERLMTFAAAEIGAQPGSSAPVMIGALSTSARAISGRISDLALPPTGPERKASASGRTSQVSGSRPERYSFALTSSLEGDESPSLREDEVDQRAAELIAAVSFATGLKRIFGRPASRLARVAAEADGRLAELADSVRNYNGRPLLLEEHVERLERLLIDPQTQKHGTPAPRWPQPRSIEEIMAELDGPLTADVGRQALAELKAKVRATRGAQPVDNMGTCSESECDQTE